MSAATNPSTYHLESLARGLAVLSSFSEEKPALSLTEISQNLKINKTTALRILSTLEALGYVRRDPDTKLYRPGLAVFRLGFVVLDSLEVRQIASPYLKQLAKDEGVEKQIIFTGSQTHIAEIYALSDVLVNASLKMGNVARTIIESLAMNTPVIATTFEGLNNIIIDGVNGAIIETQNVEDLAEKIKILYKDLPQNVQETLPYEFTLDALVENTLQVYEELL